MLIILYLFLYGGFCKISDIFKSEIIIRETKIVVTLKTLVRLSIIPTSDK